MSVYDQQSKQFPEESIEQYKAELAIINSIQAALSAQLDMQGIFSAVGEKLREIFNDQDATIYSVDLQTHQLHIEYSFEKGQLLEQKYVPMNSLYEYVVAANRPFVFNGDFPEFAARFPDYHIPQGEMPINAISVPVPKNRESNLIVYLTLQDVEGKRAFTDADVNLLTTIANSIGVALENARLFEETQRLLKETEQRNAELAIINRVQEGLVKQLDFQSIIDLVGDELVSIFPGPKRNADAHAIFIALYDAHTDLVSFPYWILGTGERLSAQTVELGKGLVSNVIHSRQSMIYKTHEEKVQAGVIHQFPDRPGRHSNSWMGAPILVGDKVTGVLTVQDPRENLYTEEDARLLSTLAAALGTALENARLFEETQRLFKAEQARVAELEIINSIQQGLAAELDFQAIIDLVGDKLREVLGTRDMMISWYDEKSNFLYQMYAYEHGKRLKIEPMAPVPNGVFEQIRISRQPVIANTPDDFEGVTTHIEGTDFAQSAIFVPIISGDRVLGLINVENYEREFAFGESEQRLLTTIAASLGTALENARLFDETQRLLKETEQRNAELAILNSVSDALSKNLNEDAIIKIVGDQVRDTFKAEVTTIHFFDQKKEQITTPYYYDQGYVDTVPPFKLGEGMASVVIRKRQPLLLLTVEEEMEAGGILVHDAKGGGGDTKSYLGVPIIVGSNLIGVVTVQSYEEHAFQQNHVSLLSTLASSMGVAIANARQFQAEQARVAELQIINSVQQGLAEELNFQAIVDLVGDKLREVLETGDLGINWYDEKANLLVYLYAYEHGKRLSIEPMAPVPNGVFEQIRISRHPMVANTVKDFEGVTTHIEGTDYAKSTIAVPIISSDRVLGLINVDNYEREYAFGEAEQRLLTTIAASLGSALENARLFDETQRLFKAEQERVGELQIINSIQQGLAAELDFQAIIDLVGDKLCQVLDSGNIGIRWYDEKANLVHYLYEKEHGQRLTMPPTTPSTTGPFIKLLNLRQPVVINTTAELVALEIPIVPGTDQSKSVVDVPIISSDRFIGVIHDENFEREYAYGEAELRLLTTIAASLGTALENARLFDETQRLFKAEQERVAELEIINSIQKGLAAELDFQAIVNLVGDKLRELFKTGNLGITWFDEKANLVHYLYGYEHGKRIFVPPTPPSKGGIYENEMKSHQPYVMGALEMAKTNPMPGTDRSLSAAFIPIISSDRFLGDISIENFERENAFGEAEIRLLTTIAASLGTALENARLFDETQRLLKETEQRAAELSILNSVGDAMSRQLDIKTITTLVGDKVRDIFTSEVVIIWLYNPETRRFHPPYVYDKGFIDTEKTDAYDSGLDNPLKRAIVEDRKSMIFGTSQELLDAGAAIYPSAGGEEELTSSFMGVPIVIGDQVIGVVSVQSYREHAYDDSNLRLLSTLAASMGVAIENARLFQETQRLLDETQQRNSELAIINSVQAALAAELNIQGIYDAVGDKIRQIFHSDNLEIRIWDPKSNLIHIPYLYEKNRRVSIEPHPRPEKGFAAHILNTGETLVINENMQQEVEKYGSFVFPDTELDKSAVMVPLIVGNQVRGLVNLSNFEREHAFRDSDVRLLQTLVNSMSVALENARLFDETQRLLKETEQRAAELTILNSVGDAMSSQLDIKTITALVGDKVREIFASEAVIIWLYNPETQFLKAHYVYDKGYIDTEHTDAYDSDVLTDPIYKTIIMDRKSLLFGKSQELLDAGAKLWPDAQGGEGVTHSFMGVPISIGDQVKGLVSVQSYKENVYDPTSLRLLSTLAASMGVAIENARLFQETQRLLDETQQRNNELAIINSVQAALAAELNIQGIYDAVGDKIRQIFHSDNLEIRVFDPKTNQEQFPYIYEKGVRIEVEPLPRIETGIAAHVARTREILIVNENYSQIMESYGAYTIPGTEPAKSAVYVPLIVGEQVRGLVGLSDFEKEHGFSDSDIRLLQTLVNSMSVALENARLFNETQRLLAETEQRNSELAIINSVQAALAAELNIQGIYDAVGDKIRQIFNSNNLEIRIWDPMTNLESFPYLFEKGERIEVEAAPREEKGFGAYIARTRETLVINENITQEAEQYGSYVVPGTDSPKSVVYVPLVVGEQVRGMIGLADFEREHAFSNSDVRLLQTLVNSMSVALENARLFNETQRLLEETRQRATELSIINHVSQSMSRQLQVEAIVQTVGDQIRDTLHSEVVNIYLYDPLQKMIHLPYSWDRKYVQTESFPYGSGLTTKVIDSLQPLILASFKDIVDNGALLNPNEPGDELMPQSYVGVPIIVGEKAIGVIDVQSYTQCVYDDSHVRLLSTLASSMGVALENARLFEETRRLLSETEQRNRELAIISRIGQALVGQLDPQGIYELVGEELQQVFDAQVVAIITYDRDDDLCHWRYAIEKGNRQSIPPSKPGGFSGHILRTRQPILIASEYEKHATEYGSTVVAGEAPKSYLGVPLIAGGESIGVITLQNIDRQGAFSQNDLRLLSTLALSMGVALENARLYQETQHHAVEMATLAEIGSDIASTHEMEPVLERMATKTRELMGVRDIALYLLQPDGHSLKAIVSQGKYAEETKAAVISLGQGITGSVAQSGIAEIVNDPEHDPRVINIPGTPGPEEEPEIFMLAPLISRGRVIGVMSVYRDREQGLFTQLELDFLVSLARQAAIAIESARLYAETERRATEMAALAEVSREISATLELQVVLERIAGQARELLGAANSAVYLLQPDGTTIKAIAAAGDIAQEVLADEVIIGAGIIGNIVKNGVAERIEDTVNDPRGVHIPGTEETDEGEKLLVAPLLTQERAIGALAAWRDPGDAPFNQAELNFSINLAQQAVVAIENARLFESAQESQRRMADIINFLPDATFVVDREGKVIAWNQAIEVMTGVKAADILGKGDYEYALPFYGKRRPILIDTVLLPNDEIEAEYDHIQRFENVLVGEAVSFMKGEKKYLNATASALKNSRGEAVGAIESIRDITDQKQAEQELQQAKLEAEAANQAKSAFLAMMSHEIRTPMNAIIGMSGLLMDTMLTPDQREFAETIRSSGDSLLSIINDILDFSKVEAGKMTLEEVPFDLRECVEVALDLVKIRASEKSLELAYQIEPGVPPAILGDVTRLRQVLINLLGNSVKFTEAGEIVLTVSKGEEKDSLHFAVRDTGIGISPDRIGLLFRAFTQADASTSRRYGGTGLGLALSSRIVELMGGRIWVESEGVPGKGSTFHFIISAKAAPDWKRHLHMEGEHPQLRDKRALIVDDNATNRRILQLQMQAWGMLPVECVTPFKALETLRAGEHFDVAILDMQMPEMSGVELADEIRKLEASKPEAKHMPLVLSTSLGGREEARESIEFAAILLKPIRQSALFDMLMTLFAGQAETKQKPAVERGALDPEMAAKHPLRILLAEDNAVNQKLALRLLSQMGYRADVAANGLEVLQAVKRQPYDVILMDMQMPEMDGLEATRRLCADYERDERPRIIAMTANAMQGDREMCLEAGMDDYLSKPIRVDELVAALRQAHALQGG